MYPITHVADNEEKMQNWSIIFNYFEKISF